MPNSIRHVQVIWNAVGFEMSPISRGQTKMDFQCGKPTHQNMGFVVLETVEWGEVKGYPLPRTAERYSVSSILAASFVENGAMTNLKGVNTEDFFKELSCLLYITLTTGINTMLDWQPDTRSPVFWLLVSLRSLLRSFLPCCYFLLMYSYAIQLKWRHKYSVFNEVHIDGAVGMLFSPPTEAGQTELFNSIFDLPKVVTKIFYSQLADSFWEWIFVLGKPGKKFSQQTGKVWPPLDPIGSSCFLASWHESRKGSWKGPTRV